MHFSQFDKEDMKTLFCNTSIFYFCDFNTFIHTSVFCSRCAEVRPDKDNAVINNCNKYQVNVQHTFHCIQFFVRMSFHRLLLPSKERDSKKTNEGIFFDSSSWPYPKKFNNTHTHTHTNPYYSAKMLIFLHLCVLVMTAVHYRIHNAVKWFTRNITTNFQEIL